jgi:DNA-binding NarL/FixJ family response regulator
MKISDPRSRSLARSNSLIELRERRTKERLAMVLCGLQRGLPQTEIAKEMGLASRSVRAYVHRLCKLAGIDGRDGHRRIQLVQRSLREKCVGVNLRYLFRPKELRILDLVARGWTNQQIGDELHHSELVIKNFLRAIFDKAGVDWRLELYLWWKAHAEEAKLFERMAVISPTRVKEAAGYSPHAHVIELEEVSQIIKELQDDASRRKGKES